MSIIINSAVSFFGEAKIDRTSARIYGERKADVTPTLVTLMTCLRSFYHSSLAPHLVMKHTLAISAPSADAPKNFSSMLFKLLKGFKVLYGCCSTLQFANKMSIEICYSKLEGDPYNDFEEAYADDSVLVYKYFFEDLLKNHRYFSRSLKTFEFKRLGGCVSKNNSSSLFNSLLPRLVNLETVRFLDGNNMYPDMFIGALQDSHIHNKYLRELEIRSCSCFDDECFKKCLPPSLEKLSVFYWGDKNVTFSTFCQMGEKCPKLKEVSLNSLLSDFKDDDNNNDVDDENSFCFPETLEVLQLSCCLCFKTKKHYEKMFGNLSNLRSLKLASLKCRGGSNNNDDDHDENNPIVPLLLQQQQEQKSSLLTKLELIDLTATASNTLGLNDESLDRIFFPSSSLAVSSLLDNLSVLRLSKLTSVSNQMIQKVLSRLSSNNTAAAGLRILDFSYSNLDDSCLDDLSNVLSSSSSSSTLEELNISNSTNITDMKQLRKKIFCFSSSSSAAAAAAAIVVVQTKLMANEIIDTKGKMEEFVSSQEEEDTNNTTTTTSPFKTIYLGGCAGFLTQKTTRRFSRIFRNLVYLNLKSYNFPAPLHPARLKDLQGAVRSLEIVVSN
jgi:hypothetical protein